MADHTIPLGSPLAHEIPIEGGVLGMIVGANTARYVNLAALILLFYDHVTTLDKEVERIWTLPWRLPKILFLMNRYILSLSFIFGWVVFTIYDATIPLYATPLYETDDFTHEMAAAILSGYGKCGQAELPLCPSNSSSFFAFWHYIMGETRNSQALTWFIGLLYFCEVCSLLALNIINIRNTGAIDAWMHLPSCSRVSIKQLVGNHRMRIENLFNCPRIPPIIFEGIIVILTFYEVYPYRHDHANSTVRILARDSAVYFIFMMSIHVVNFVIWRTDAFVFGDAYATPSSVMSCVAVSHMMMNLRGLSPDIQLDTQHRHGHPDSVVIESIPMFTTSPGPDLPDVP